MKILHAMTSINPSHGGSVEAVRQMTRAMRRFGVETEVLALVAPEPAWLEAWPVKVHSLGKTLSYYCYTKRLVSWLEAEHDKYDAVVVHGVWRYQSFGVWRALRSKPIPYFLFTHGMLHPWFQQTYPLKHVKKTIFWRLAEHRVLRDAKAVLYTTVEERELAHDSFRPYQCRERVIGLGIGGPPTKGADQEMFLRHFPDLRGKRVLLFLGRIHRMKGCDLLIRAFAHVASRDARLHLVFAGDDQTHWRADLERLASSCGISNRIKWTGHLDSDLKWGAIRAAETFVLPSRWESYGLAIVEAMACGVPVLISDKASIRNEVREYSAGLTGADSVEGVRDLLANWCCMDSEQQRTMRENARRCFEERFELNLLTRCFVEFLAIETGTVMPPSMELSTAS
jgi:glycosyltransferase involved in cell wall biosynthesis